MGPVDLHQVPDLFDLSELQQDFLGHLLEEERGNDAEQEDHARSDLAAEVPQGPVMARLQGSQDSLVELFRVFFAVHAAADGIRDG